MEIAEDDRREAALQAYFDRMAELLLKEKLRQSVPEAEVRAVARARTSTALRRLDAASNRSLLQFLYESELIANNAPLQILVGTDLSKAKLEGANLEGANLEGANLQWANLQEANLQGATVTDEQLVKAASLKNATMPDGTKHD